MAFRYGARDGLPEARQSAVRSTARFSYIFQAVCGIFDWRGRFVGFFPNIAQGAFCVV